MSKMLREPATVITVTNSCPKSPPGKHQQAGRTVGCCSPAHRPLPRQAKGLFPTLPPSSRVNKVNRQPGLQYPKQVQPYLAHVDRHKHLLGQLTSLTYQIHIPAG